MTKRKMVGLIIIPVMVLSLASSRAQQWPVSGFYQIISGGYSQCFEVCFGLGVGSWATDGDGRGGDADGPARHATSAGATTQRAASTRHGVDGCRIGRDRTTGRPTLPG